MAKRFSDNALLERAMNEAARQAAVDHKRAGLKMIGWSDGKIVEFGPDEILSKSKPVKKRSPKPRRKMKIPQ